MGRNAVSATSATSMAAPAITATTGANFRPLRAPLLAFETMTWETRAASGCTGVIASYMAMATVAVQLKCNGKTCNATVHSECQFAIIRQ